MAFVLRLRVDKFYFFIIIFVDLWRELIATFQRHDECFNSSKCHSTCKFHINFDLLLEPMILISLRNVN